MVADKISEWAGNETNGIELMDDLGHLYHFIKVLIFWSNDRLIVVVCYDSRSAKASCVDVPQFWPITEEKDGETRKGGCKINLRVLFSI